MNVKFTATGEAITLDEQFYSHLYWGIDRVEFCDGVVRGRHDLLGAALYAVNGIDGNDTLTGTSVHVSFYRSLGSDTLDFAFNSGSLTFDLAIDRVTGIKSSFEDFTNIEKPITSAGNVRIITSVESNTLTGGGGNDTFVFKDVAGGYDTITDFSAGAGTQDLIELGTDQFSDFAAVIAAATDDGVDTTIAINADTSIVLKSVLVADLHQDDFQFG